MNKVLITDFSLVTPIGETREEFFHSLETGSTGIGNVKEFDDNDFPSKLGAEISVKNSPIKYEKGCDKKELFLSQTLERLLEGNPVFEETLPMDRVLSLGMGLDYFDLERYVENTDSALGNWQKYSNNTFHFAEQLALDRGIRGGVHINVSACVASSQAIGFAYRYIQQNPKKMLIAGGADSMLNQLHYIGFYKLGALSTWEGAPESGCKPFDKKRCGLVLGEGAALLLMQSSEQADPEKCLCEIAGYSSSMDAYSVTDPDPEGKALAQAAKRAVEEASISPDMIDCVHLHGTGTVKNELAETNAMKEIFRSRFDEIPVFSMKGQVGHLISACGAAEMIGVIYSLIHQKVPVTVNYEEPDPLVTLNVIKGEPLSRKIDYVLKLNSAFGGQNTAFVVKRYE